MLLELTGGAAFVFSAFNLHLCVVGRAGAGISGGSEVRGLLLVTLPTPKVSQSASQTCECQIPLTHRVFDVPSSLR